MYPLLIAFATQCGCDFCSGSLRWSRSYSYRCASRLVTPALFAVVSLLDFEAVQIAMAAQTGRDSSNLVVDMVCDVCRVEGFEVEKNVQAGESESHFVDIIASRKKGDKTQKVAFE